MRMMASPMNADPDNSTTRVGAPLSPLAEGVYCPDCGYDLRGSTSPRCPECGYDLALLRSGESLIPWVHRRQIGRLRAYVRTAWLVTFRNRQFCAEVARTVSYADAQRFRWTTVAIAYVTLLASQVVYSQSLAKAGVLQFLAGIEWFAIPIAIAPLLALAALTGLPSYFFHPRHLPVALQDRAIALSYYTCAPLAFSWIAFVFAGMISGCDSPTIERIVQDDRALFVGYALCLPLFALWAITLVSCAVRLLHRPTRAWLIAIAVPLLWVIVGGVLLLGLPILTFYVVLMVYAWP